MGCRSGSVLHVLDVVQSERGGDRTADDDADDGRPKPQRRRAPQDEGHNDDDGCQGDQRRSRGGSPSGTSASMPNTMGMTVAAISMMTVPETTGVKIRRRTERRAARANWNSADMTTRLAITAGPPSTSAATQTAKNAPEAPMTRMCPAPMRQTRAAGMMVVMPLISSAANTAHARYSAG